MNLDTQSSDISAVENRVREVIPAPDTLGKETMFIGLYTSRVEAEMPLGDYFYNA